MKKSTCMYVVAMTYIYLSIYLYRYSTRDVPKYPFSKSGVPVLVPVPKFLGNLGFIPSGLRGVCLCISITKSIGLPILCRFHF